MGSAPNAHITTPRYESDGDSKGDFFRRKDNHFHKSSIIHIIEYYAGRHDTFHDWREYSVGRQNVYMIRWSILSADIMLATIQWSTLSADIMLATIGESTFMTDPILVTK